MKRNIFKIVAFTLLFILSGCGSNSKADGSGAVIVTPTAAVMSNVKVVQDNTGINFTLPIEITKELDSAYLVNLSGYDLTIGGCSINTISYNPSPLNLSGGVNSKGTIDVSGTFDQNCTVTGYTFTATQTISRDGKSDVSNFSATFDYANPGAGGTPPPAVAGYAFANPTTPLIVSQANTAYDLKVQLQLDGFLISGETVRLKSFPAQYGDVANPNTTTGADGYARFSYTSPTTLPLNGPIATPLEIVFIDENNATYTQLISIDFQSAGAGGGTQYSLINPTSIVVTAANSTKNITIDLIDSATGVGVSGKNISITTIDSAYGSVAASTVVTDSAGKAIFVYTAPSALVTGIENATLSFTDDAGNTISQAITVSTIAPAGGGTQYSFINETNLTVTAANTEYTISIDLIDPDGVGAASESVRITAISNTYGTITPATANTDSGGRATFTYTSPLTLTAGSVTTHASFTDSNGDTIQKDISITVVPPVGGGTQYSLVNETNVSISRANQVELVSVNVVDSTTGVGVAGKVVSISTLPAGYGVFSASTALTDASGKAEFSYTAPSDISSINLTAKNATLSFTENGVTISKVVTFDFNETIISSDYNLTNANDITISFAGESKEIAVQLIKNGVPQAGESVVAKSIPVAYGTISTATVPTGTDGFARFTYIAATPLTDVNTTLELVYTDLNGAEITATVDINISGQAQVAEYNLTNVTTPVIVNYNDELKSISVDVVNQSGVGVAGQEVSITAVSGIEYGSIISASVAQSDASGHVSFTYQAPADVSAVDGNTSIVTLSLVTNGITITEDVTLEFNKVDLNISVPIVIISNTYKEINITSNSQTLQMEVQVFEQGTNIPYTAGNVKVSLPDSVLNGIDVGHFSEYSVPVGSNGIATFSYTGPLDLQALTASGESNATFEFFHEENPTNKESITIIYDLADNYIPANYILSTSSNDGNQTMGLQVLKSFTLYLRDDLGNLVEDANISQITITSKNTLIGKLVDATNGGSQETTLVLSGANAVNSKSFPVQTFTLSGLLPIEITVDFTDGNGDPQSLTLVMNIVVFSGPPTAMSISYAGVDQNSTLAKYTEKFVVTVTDSYNNPVNTKPYVAVGAMVEYAVDGTSVTGNRTETSPRLWHGRADGHGDLKNIGGNSAQFEAVGNIFSWVDFNNDRLVLFGQGFVYEALGKWDIADSGAPDTLDLRDDYNGTNRSGLFYAIGHNNRQDLCSNDGREYVGNMKATNYQLDDSGHALIEFEYDYHLTGKDIMVWVNLTGFQADNNSTGRIGEAQKHTLRGKGFVSPESYLIPFGTSNHHLSFTVEHENAPEQYRNGHFGFAVSGACSVDGIIDSSNRHDARECTRPHVYVDLNVSNPGTEDCVIELVDTSIAVSSEFTGVNSF